MKAALVMLALGLIAGTDAPTLELTNSSWDVSTIKRSTYVNVSGSITNTSAEPLRSVVVRILYKDAFGTILNVGKEAVSAIAPGQNVTFKSRTRLVAGMDQFDFEFDGIYKNARVRIPYISKVPTLTDASKPVPSQPAVAAGPRGVPSNPMNVSDPVFDLPRGDSPHLRSYSDTPPPVEEAIRAGREVWVLLGLNPFRERSSECTGSTYVILSQGRLERIVVKQEVTGTTCHVLFKTDGPVAFWDEYPAGRSRPGNAPGEPKTSSSKLSYSWNGLKRGSSIDLELCCDLKVDNNRIDLTAHDVSRITVDATWDVGKWELEKRSSGAVKYKNGLRLPPEDPKTRYESGQAEHLLPEIPG